MPWCCCCCCCCYGFWDCLFVVVVVVAGVAAAAVVVVVIVYVSTAKLSIDNINCKTIYDWYVYSGIIALTLFCARYQYSFLLSFSAQLFTYWEALLSFLHIQHNKLSTWETIEYVKYSLQKGISNTSWLKTFLIKNVCSTKKSRRWL